MQKPNLNERDVTLASSQMPKIENHKHNSVTNLLSHEHAKDTNNFAQCHPTHMITGASAPRLEVQAVDGPDVLVALTVELLAFTVLDLNLPQRDHLKFAAVATGRRSRLR